MPYRKSKYSTVQNQMLDGAVMGVLSDSPTALTISEICVRDMTLTNQTSQKMARVLNNLIDMGLVRKARSKRTQRMKYIAVSQLLDQGYDIDDFVVE